MQHLNYCRQITKQCMSMLEVPNIARQQADKFLHVLSLCKASQKFLMPENGRLFDDPDLRALDSEFELRLPHPFIALEYAVTGDFIKFDHDIITKDVVFAWEIEDGVLVQRVGYSNAHGAWGIGNVYKLPRTGFLREAEGGYRRFVFHTFAGETFTVPDPEPDAHGASQLLCFLNALSCSNVRVEKSEGGKTQKAMRKKGALAFDDYHVLTIDVPGHDGGTGAPHGSSRSPREHLRRGHIRRYANGLKVWVNATVVNAGIGGKVAKDYRVRGA